ncbi:MAG: hypothetical protein QOE95_1913, partial [Gaiellaceae bacterium]|nr:hypothetical protein [Gaiellaceae bacterium]
DAAGVEDGDDATDNRVAHFADIGWPAH